VTNDSGLRPLGRSGLPVSRLGLGLAALGRPGYINVGHRDDLAGRTEVAVMERRAHTLLDAAYEAGIRYFDAARSYGKAEAFLASWLEQRELPPGEVTVGSKWGYTYAAEWRVDAERHEVKDLSVTTLRRQLAESRELLGPHLLLYQIHSATLESGFLDDRAVLEELRRLRESGLAIGVTVTGAHQAETIERALEVGAFDTIQATWNLLERSAGPMLAEAHAGGLGVIVKEALANGRLTARGDLPTLLELSHRRAVAPDALALAAVLAQPWADVVLSGAATVETLRSNVTALELELELGECLDPELGALAEEPARYWEERATLPWN
jgi:aryl-alcohol dehydrogenase-like predicted oxidoreductase